MDQKTPLLAAWALSLTLLAASPSAGRADGAEQATRSGRPAATAPTEEPPRRAPLRGETLDRHELVEAVLARNPEIAAARAAWRAARARIPQAGSLADPQASYSLAPLSIASSDVQYGDVLRVGQRIPFPGKLDLREEVAAAEAEAAESGIEEARLRLATMATRLWDDYWLVERGLEINEEHRALLDSFQRVATSRYATGLVSQQAPLQAEVEAAHLLHEEVVLTARRRVLTAQINALLHRRPDAALPAPSRALEELIADHGAPDDDAALEAAALRTRPELQIRGAEIEAREAAVDLEKLEAKPDFELMTSYNSMWSMPEHRWMVGVGVNLPIWRERIRAEIAEAEAELDVTRSQHERTLDEVREQVAVALQALREAHHVVELYRDRVLPAARDRIQAARSGFETGASTMLALIDAERSLRASELSYYEAVAEAASRRAELDRALGRIPGDLQSESLQSVHSMENRR